MHPKIRLAAVLSGLCLAVPAMAAGVEVPNPLGDAQTAPPAPSGARASRRASPAPASVGPGAVFPKAVDPRYGGESAGRARMHTCLDQYRANARAGNGGLRWIERGGGYYSECNRRLKG